MFTIRPLENTAEDHAQWLELWRSYLGFYESQVSAETTAHNWAGFHDPSSPLDALAAFDADGKMLGMAMTVMHESNVTAQSLYDQLAVNEGFIQDVHAL